VLETQVQAGYGAIFLARQWSQKTSQIRVLLNSIFGDNMMTVAAIDRLVHHADIYKIEGASYRKKHALKSHPITG